MCHHRETANAANEWSKLPLLPRFRAVTSKSLSSRHQLTTQSAVNTHHQSRISPFPGTLATARLFDNADYSDITIRIGDTQLKCHKLVICSFEYFEKLCGARSHFFESQQDTIELHDHDPIAHSALVCNSGLCHNNGQRNRLQRMEGSEYWAANHDDAKEMAKAMDKLSRS